MIAKPVGAQCNMDCAYCYYLDKRALYNKGQPAMPEDILERFIDQYIGAQTQNNVLFTWHGGEALLRKMDFFHKALSLQQHYGRKYTIENSIQTNGSLLTDDWCRFFHDNHFLVGISIDGPLHMHDRYRRMKNGNSSFYHVMRGVEKLQRFDVEFNVLATVNDYNVHYPLECYSFFKENGFRYIQFTPIVERLNGIPAPYNVTPDDWGNFLITIFNEWIQHDVASIFVNYFDNALASWTGHPADTCIFAQTCGHSGVIEHNGDVYSCDHFVNTWNKLGNIRTSTLIDMMYSERQLIFGQDKRERLCETCRQCEYLFACHGECPKNRIANENGSLLNYLCSGYLRFFHHITPAMEFMKHELIHHRPPANIMKAISSNNIDFRQNDGSAMHISAKGRSEFGHA